MKVSIKEGQLKNTRENPEVKTLLYGSDDLYKHHNHTLVNSFAVFLMQYLLFSLLPMFPFVHVCKNMLLVFQRGLFIIRVTFVLSCGAIWMRPTHM